jgi:hypothetical protein
MTDEPFKCAGERRGRWSSGRPLPAYQFITQSAAAQREIAALRKSFFEAYPGIMQVLSADYGVIEARAMAHELAVNPNPYYSWTMCRHSLTVVQLAIAAIEGDYRSVECFNHAVDGGIVFG